MRFEPIDLASQPERLLQASSIIRIESNPAQSWSPIFSSQSAFSAEIFNRVILNLIRNPNHNSGYLFRADILFDEDCDGCVHEHGYGYDGVEDKDERDGDGNGNGNGNEDSSSKIKPIELEIQSFSRTRTIVRKLIPRNPQLDKPLLQTCHFYTSSSFSPVAAAAAEEEGGQEPNIVVYLPHASSPEEIPFYHPTVRGLAFIHTPTTISIQYSYFSSPPNPALQPRLNRTALHLLQTLHRHGQGQAAGYVKRVYHDLILPQAVYQNTYTGLKIRHAKRLVDNWAESTDAAKHAFEDLGIAAFLIELWRGMYDDDPTKFPGFVDIGCGNGVLVDILLREGWKGWGFDARRRKSWSTFPEETRACLKEMLLFPSPLLLSSTPASILQKEIVSCSYHTGIFPPNTFLISNHADELTPWTPILGALANNAPFLIIPCCSHDLSGAKFRAPPMRSTPSLSSASSPSSSGRSTDNGQAQGQGKGLSAYATLCDWVEGIAIDLGYQVEREALRIPSTRNTALVARKGIADRDGVHGRLSVEEVLRKYAGDDISAVGRSWVDRAKKITKMNTR